MGVRLPSAYQEVEYIEGTGTQWFNVGIYPDANTWVHAKLYTISTGNRNWFGVQYGSNRSFCFNSYDTTYIEYSYGSQGWVHEYYSGAVGKILDLYFAKDSKITINGTVVVSNLPEISGTSEWPLYIFKRGQGNAPVSGRLYLFDVYSGNNLVCSLIPCYRKSDDKPGMYDLVTETFFINQGTGEFLVGADVIDSISPWLVARRRALMARKPFDCPYVKDGLIFWLDGIRKGDDPTVWKDLVRGITFDMTNVIFTETGVDFSNNGNGKYAGNVSTNWENETIEAACSYCGDAQSILYPAFAEPMPIGLVAGAGNNVGYCLDGNRHPRASAAYGWKVLSVNKDIVIRNGVNSGFGITDSWGRNNEGYTYIGTRHGGTYQFTHTMHCIRIYNRKLSEQEILFNQSVDNARFNLGLSI